MDVGCSQWGFEASTMTPQHHTGSAIPQLPKFHSHLHTYYSIRMHPYANPQHLKVLKHFVYIQYGCGMQSMGVLSLNHDTATSYSLGHTPFFLILTPHLHTYYSIRMHPYAHPQHLKVLKLFVYIQYGYGMQSMGLLSVNHDTATSYRLSHTSFSLTLNTKIHPHVHMYYGIRVYPYAHPQHLKVLKHFVYI